MSEIKHLKCISAVKSMASVKHLTPAAFPGNHCPMHTALSLGTRIEGISTLVIGTPECAYYSRNIPAASPQAERARHWTYVLDGSEVVFGFRKGLMEAIKEMDQANARVILLIGTCIPEVIGEDIEGIIDELEDQVNTRLLYVPLGNFKCGSHQPGYWKTLLALGKLINPSKRQNRQINVLGRSVIEEHIPQPKLLSFIESQGIGLRYLAPDAGLDDFTAAGDARLNLVISPFLNPLAEYMDNIHNIPYYSLHDIYKTDEINALYGMILKTLEIEADEEFNEDFQEAQILEEEARIVLNGKSFISTRIGAVQPLPWAVFLAKLGMLPVMIHMEEFYPADKVWRQRLLDLDINPIVCMMVNEQADRQLIGMLGADMIIGDWGGQISENSAAVQIFDLYGQIGYERSITLLKRMIKQGKEV